MGRRKKRNGSILIFLVEAIAFAVMVYCGYHLFKKYSEYHAGSEAYDHIRSEAVKEYPGDTASKDSETSEGRSDGETDDETVDGDKRLYIDWEAMPGTDCVAWLQLGEISYPVMQSDDDEFYLHHLPDGTYNYGGSLFLYSQNDKQFGDANSFIYGHNMKDRSMFGKLKDYMDSGHADDTFSLYLPDGTRHQYRFFAVVSVPEDSEAYTWSFGSEEAFLSWQEWMKQRSMYVNQAQPSADAQYVSLSTCDGVAGTTQRLIVCGQLEKVEQLQEPAEWMTEAGQEREQ